MADKRAKSAMVAARAPICAAKYQGNSSFDTKLSELNDTRAYQRAAFIEDGGWATMPGSDKGDRDVAKACADMITELGATWSLSVQRVTAPRICVELTLP